MAFLIVNRVNQLHIESWVSISMRVLVAVFTRGNTENSSNRLGNVVLCKQSGELAHICFIISKL
jgi:hypothetical protein